MLSWEIKLRSTSWHYTVSSVKRKHWQTTDRLDSPQTGNFASSRCFCISVAQILYIYIYVCTPSLNSKYQCIHLLCIRDIVYTFLYNCTTLYASVQPTGIHSKHTFNHWVIIYKSTVQKLVHLWPTPHNFSQIIQYMYIVHTHYMYTTNVVQRIHIHKPGLNSQRKGNDGLKSLKQT